MVAYMVIRAQITDPEKFANYGKSAAKLVEKFGGNYEVMRPSQDILLEGESELNMKLVISKWPSIDTALAFWNSPEYSEIKKLRENAGTVIVRLVEGTS